MVSQRGTLHLLDDARHGERFAAAGNAHQRLMNHSLIDAVDGHVNGFRLVAGGNKV